MRNLFRIPVGKPQISLQSAPVLYALMVSMLVLYSCKERPPWVSEGALFSGPEAPPTGKSLVYIYWPAEGPETKRRVWVTPGSQFTEEIWRGGYTVIAVPPGPTPFLASFIWDLTVGVGGSVSQELGGVKADLHRDKTYYLRIEQGPKISLTRLALREVEAAVAVPEVGKCRQMEPLTRWKRSERNALKHEGASGEEKP